MSTAGSESAIFEVPNSMFCNVGVDYFQHKFEFEEVHSCWRKIHLEEIDSLSKRRLYNLCWRKFFQDRDSIPRLNPSVINWKKRNETNWLYGPVFKSGSGPAGQTSSNSLVTQSSQLCPDAPKSILKKRTRMQSFLQSILSTGSGYFFSRARHRVRRHGCEHTSPHTSDSVLRYTQNVSIGDSLFPIFMQAHEEYPCLQGCMLHFSKQVCASAITSPCASSPPHSDQGLSELYSDYLLIHDSKVLTEEVSGGAYGDARDASNNFVASDSDSVCAEVSLEGSGLELEDGMRSILNSEYSGYQSTQCDSDESSATSLQTSNLSKCLRSLSSSPRPSDRTRSVSFQNRLAVLLDSVLEELGVGFRLLEIEQNHPALN